MNTILLARLTLRDGFGNLSQLDVRRGANDELVLHLGCEAISNLHHSGRQPPPAFCMAGHDARTVDEIEAWVNAHTFRKVLRTERGPSARRSAPEASKV